ncbi:MULTISPECIES: DUF2970 domain-containing protein [Niveibacterium]|uniref:DUF2970 domain-containing protein n=1 Tax=Niveibacterium microcysteis TaxID=2811415 RepID=A0ABX7MD55_9RHOO|nr:DUF2970 domain-containing protein [Niveibacterium microcysteis]QSI77612.1 DUF2970 domain-containing protein [Niveibacterium microcysteis]
MTATPRAGFLATLRAVLWSFIGVRKRQDYQQDASSLNPLAVVVAGLIAGALFIFTLVMVVSWVTASP